MGGVHHTRRARSEVSARGEHGSAARLQVAPGECEALRRTGCFPLARQTVRSLQGPQVREGPWPPRFAWLPQLNARLTARELLGMSAGSGSAPTQDSADGTSGVLLESSARRIARPCVVCIVGDQETYVN